MARSYQSDKATAWRERIRRFGRSGLTVVRFCEQEGVSTASFYRWRGRLSAQQTPARNTQARRMLPKHGLESMPAFRPVQILPAGTPLSIHLPGGVRVEVPLENLDAVRAVVGELAERSAASKRGDGSC